MQPVYLPTNYSAPQSLENSPFTKALRNTLIKGNIYIFEKLCDVLLCRAGKGDVSINMGSLIQ